MRFIAAAFYQPPYLPALPRRCFWGIKSGGFRTAAENRLCVKKDRPAEFTRAIAGANN